MDFLRAGEALLRSSQPLLPFLAPSAYRSTRAVLITRHCKKQAVNYQPFRCISASQPRSQQGTAAAIKEEDEQPSQPATPSTTDEFSNLLDSALDFDKGTPAAPTGRTSRFKSPSAQQYNSPSRQSAAEQQRKEPSRSPETDGAISELLNSMIPPSNPRRQSQRQDPPPAPGTPRRSTPTSSSFLDIESLLDPLQTNQRAQPATYGPPPPALPQQAPMKLNSSVGRTIRVDNNRGVDVARAFRALEIQCARNSVRRDFQRQRFHERPGLKRKRLKSDRWRKRFKEAFKGTIGMVQRMRGMGWGGKVERGEKVGI